MKYVVNYVAGYGYHGRDYCTIVEAASTEAAGEAVTKEKLLTPHSFDWVKVESVETVEAYHSTKEGEACESV